MDMIKKGIIGLLFTLFLSVFSSSAGITNGYWDKIKYTIKIGYNGIAYGGTNEYKLTLSGYGDIKKGDVVEYEIDKDGNVENVDARNPPWIQYWRTIYWLTLEDGITGIGAYNFTAIKNLKWLTLPNTLKHIGEYAFMDCQRIYELNLPDNIETIGYKAFYRVKFFIELNLPYNLKTIHDYAFENCYGLKNITIKDNLDYIGSGAFKNCGSLNHITVNRSTPPRLGSNVFEGVNSNTVLTINTNDFSAWQEALKTTEWGKFVVETTARNLDVTGVDGIKNPVDLTKPVQIQKGYSVQLTSIVQPKEYVKNQKVTYTTNNSKVATVTAGGLVKAVEAGETRITVVSENGGVGVDINILVYGDKTTPGGIAGNNVKWSLKNGVFALEGYGGTYSDYGVERKQQWYDRNEEITSIVVGEGITHINANLFYKGLPNVKYISLPSTLTHIGTNAFRNLEKLETLTLPVKLETIDENGFFYLPKLKTVINLNPTPQVISKTVLSKTQLSINLNRPQPYPILKVPKRGLFFYRKEPEWEKYFIEEIVEKVTDIKSVSVDEPVSIYTLNGEFINTSTRQNGKVILPENTPKGVYIVKGSSGVEKIVK